MSGFDGSAVRNAISRGGKTVGPDVPLLVDGGVRGGADAVSIGRLCSSLRDLGKDLPA